MLQPPPGVGAVLFAVALALAILVPNLGYWALFVMLLTGLAQRMLERLFGVPAPAKKRARSSKR